MVKLLSSKQVFSQTAVVGLLLFLIAIGLFLPAADFDFIVYDDDLFISKNPHVRNGLSWDNVRWALSADLVSDSPNADFWIPVTFLSHILTAELFGMNPSAHHLVNVVLHALNTVLLFWVLRRMTRDLWPSAFVAVLFAIHPLHVESVAWVSERKDVLSTLFFLLTIGAYVRYTERPIPSRYVLVGLLFALGLMSKPMLVTLPFVLLLLDYWPLGRLHLVGPRDNQKIINPSFLIIEKLPLFVLSAAIAIGTLHLHYKGGTIASLESLPFGVRVAHALVSYFNYIKQMIWPKNLAIFYPHPGDSLALSQVVVAGVTLTIILILVLWLIKTRPYLAVGWFWYLGTLIPVIGLLQAGAQAMADRYTYIPLIGLFIMIGWGGQDLIARWRYRNLLLKVSAAIVFSGLIICASMQLRYWRNSITLFEHALQIADKNFIAHYNLGLGYLESGNLEEAVQQFQATLRLDPDAYDSHNELGVILYEQKKFEEAKIQFLKSLQIKPGYLKAQNNLALLTADQGEIEESMSYFTRALEAAPDSPVIHNSMGMVLHVQGRNNEAIDHFSHAVRINPNSAVIRSNLARSLYAQGRTEEALSHYAKAVQISPDFDEAYYGMGIIYIDKGLLDEGIRALKMALRLKHQSREYRTGLGEAYRRNGEAGQAIVEFKKLLESHSADVTVHTNLGLAYADQGRMQEAISQYKSALKIDPDFVEAHFNLALAYTSLRRTDEAIQEYRAAILIQPAYTNAYNNLANIFVNQGKHQEAIQEFQLALKHNPNGETLHYNLGVIYKRLGKTKEAKNHLQQALRIKPDFNAARQALGSLE